jgi:undecaprenyl-diphosphatase
MKVEVDGTPHMAWMVFVGNGPYGAGMLDLADRDSLTEHVLDLRVVLADRPLARLRVIGALALGRLARSPLVLHRQCRAVTVALPEQDDVDVALDGEVERLQPPLQYESRPAALNVLTPRATSAPR